MKIPRTTALTLSSADGVLHVTLDRPAAGNALDPVLVEDLHAVFDAVRDDRGVRAIVLRGAGRHFCVGADLRGLGASPDRETLIAHSERFGALLHKIDRAPQAVIARVHGVALGGGFGLVCVTDIAIVAQDATLGMPETRLGLPAAQILPFVVARIGASQARRIGVCGARFDGAEALRLGVAHYAVADDAACEACLADVLADVRTCAPGANAVTKAVIHAIDRQSSMEAAIAANAACFADALLGDEGREGTRAFTARQTPSWAVTS